MQMNPNDRERNPLNFVVSDLKNVLTNQVATLFAAVVHSFWLLVMNDHEKFYCAFLFFSFLINPPPISRHSLGCLFTG